MNLGVAVTRGVFWTGLGQVIKQVVSIGTTILLARLLAPGDFGLLTMAMVGAEFATLFTDFGVGTSVIQKRKSDPRALTTCFWINIGAAFACALILVAAAPLAARYFQNPMVQSLTYATAINVILAGAVVIPQAILIRDLRFADFMRAQVVGSLVGSSVALTMGYLGAGVWSLAVQPLAGTAVSLAIMAKVSGWRPTRDFSLDSIRDMVGMSRDLFISSVLSYAGRNAHNFILGRNLGSASLGIFNMAGGITYFPIYQITAVVVRVLFPALSKLQDDLPRFRNAYLQSLAAIALCTAPLLLGLLAVLDDFVNVAFGSQWRDMIPILEITVWAVLVQSVSSSSGTVLLSTGQSRLLLKLGALSSVLTIPVLLFGARWDLFGVAVASSFITIVFAILNVWLALRQIELKLSDYSSAIFRPIGAAILMLVGVRVVASTLSSFPASVRLGVCIAFGAMLYAAANFLINRPQLIELREMFKRSFSANQV